MGNISSIYKYCIAWHVLGDQILAHGEESGRGRRRHIANKRFQKNGQERLRIMFHIKAMFSVYI